MDNRTKERLRNVCDRLRSYGYTDCIEELESIFPGLAESEDEKIRKIIRLALIGSEEELSDFYKVHKISRKECTDWLEKHGEPKAPFQFEKGYNAGYEDAMRIMNSQEQKPDKCAGCNNVKGCVTCVNGDQWAHIEEENRPQPNQDCSACSKHLEGYISGRVDCEKELLDKYNILLSPESNELSIKPHWKPSEEQMEALKEYVEEARGIHNTSMGGYTPYLNLQSLYDDLKKL